MSQESARARGVLWWRQGAEDLKAAQLLQASGQWSHACFLGQQAGEKGLKALLAARDQDLSSPSLSALFRELGPGELATWGPQARALGDAAPMDVFGAEDGVAALAAAQALMDWSAEQLGLSA
jgi:hypothetical protein